MTDRTEQTQAESDPTVSEFFVDGVRWEEYAYAVERAGEDVWRSVYGLGGDVAR